MNSTYLRALHDLLFPPHCLGCGKRLSISSVPLLCQPCLEQIQPLTSPLCTCCGIPFVTGEDHLCGLCLNEYYAFTSLRSAFYYESPVRELLLRLKFGGLLQVAPTVGALVQAAGIQTHFTEPDVIVPVPLHKKRLRGRGFNQAISLATHCFALWKKKVDPTVLSRIRDTVPQTSLSGKARRENLRHGFALTRPQRVYGKKILLVDDVCTTGSTINECARVLVRGQASSVEVFTVARSIQR